MTANIFRSNKMPWFSHRRFFGLIAAALVALAPAAWGQSSSATGTYTVTTNGSVFIYSFTGSGTFTPSAALTASLLVVGGGGGGGGAYGTTAYANEGGGGGAGGLVTNNSVALVSGTPYTVTVGGGGTAGTSTTDGGSGGSSVFGSYTATGGGGGGSATSTTGDGGGTGGSGGGGGRGHSVSGTAGSGTAGQGSSGAAGASGLSGGGGGAGAAGSSYNAGNGVASSITGTSTYYAGGGAGGENGTTKPSAGLGGGGAGGYKPSTGAVTNGSPGTPNTGGGGGGAFDNDQTVSVTGGSGGSGIVIVSYVDPASAASSTVSPSSGSEPADGVTTATITVTLKDSTGYLLTGKTVTLAQTGGLGATITTVSGTTSASGVATFTVNSSTAGVAVFTATDTTDSVPVSQTATVSFISPSATIDHFTVIPSANSNAAGSVFSAVVQAYATPGSGSPITNNSVDGTFVTLTSSGSAQFDGAGTGAFNNNFASLTNGVFTIHVRDLKAESVTLTATFGSATGTSSSVRITAGAFAQLQLLMPGETATPGVSPGYTGAPSTRTAGSGYSITVNAVDTNWNVASSSDTVNLTAANDANAILPANTALVAGSKTLSVTNIIAGSGRTLTATDVSNGGITASTSPAYSVGAGPVAQLLLMAPGESPTYGAAPGKTGTPSPQIQTAPFTLTVNALDAYYNLVTTTDTVHIASSDVGATVTTNTALYAGAATFSITPSTTGSVTDTASDVSNGGVASGTTTLIVDPIPRYRSIASGNWSSTSTWQYSTDGGTTWNPATSTPSSSTAALTEITNGVTVTVATSVVIARTTIDAGGTVSVPASVTLSIVPGSGIDLDVFGSVVNAGVVTNLNGNVTFEAGSLYNLDEDNGVLPTATWNSNSTCEVTGWAASTTCSEAMGLGQLLGNFVWNSPGMTANLSLGNSKFNGIGGNFEVLSTGSGVLNIVQNGSLTNNIGGSVIVTGGNLDLDKGDGTIQFNVAGNVTVGSGAMFDATTTNISGTIGSATVAFNTGTHTLSNAGTISGQLKWVVNSSATLDLGTAIIGSTNSFTLNPGAGVVTAKPTGLAGNLPLASTNVSLSTGGNYTYDGVSLQSGDTLLPTTVASLTVSNNLGLVLHQATTATNMALIASPLTGNLTVPNSGAMTVSGGGCSVTGNLSLNTGSLTLVSSNNFPQLTIIGGTASLNGGSVALTVLGAPIAEGTYLLVNATSGGTVSGTLPALVNLTGTGLPSWTTGIPQITGGKLYVSYQNYFSAVDNGPGFFSGENLEHEDVSGRTFLVWSTSDLTQPVSTWTLEGPAVEFPISGSSPAMSEYGITVTPSASPMYYVLAQTNIGPFSATEPLITLTTSDYVSFNVGATNTAITSGGVFELVSPVITPVTITAASARLSGRAMTFAFTNATGLNFTILATNNLAAPVTNWPAIGTAVESPAGSGSYQFTDPAAATNLQRFYRLRQP